MKFAVGLVIAAIAVSTVRAGNPALQTTLTSESGSDSASASVDSSESEDTGTSCNFACLAVMSPVTDENGVTYSNECMMRAAKCKGKRKDVDVLEEYKRLYGKSFGASRDGDTGDESASEEDGSSSGAVNILQGSPESNDSSKEESASEDGSDKGTPKSYCPNILCPAVFSPVWDENGVQYPNECSMKAAKCKGPRENVLDEYKRVYGKEFGAPRDESASDEDASNESASESDDGSSSKATKMVKGSSKAEKSEKSEKSKKATKASSDSASDIGSLYEDGSDGVIDDGSSTPSSKCASGCPDVELPVCGSDGVWYSNPCELKIAACENPDADIVEDDTACSSKVTKSEKKAGKITTDVIW